MKGIYIFDSLTGRKPDKIRNMRDKYSLVVLAGVLMGLPILVSSVFKDADNWLLRAVPAFCFLLGVAVLWWQSRVMKREDSERVQMDLARELREKERDALLRAVLSKDNTMSVRLGDAVQDTLIPGSRSRAKSLADDLYALLSQQTMGSNQFDILYKAQFKQRVNGIVEALRRDGVQDEKLDAAILQEIYGIDGIRTIADRLFYVALNA